MSIRRPRVVLALVSTLSVLSFATLDAQAAPAKPKLLEGSLSLGFSKTSGNASATTTNVANKIKYTVKGWAVAQDLLFVYGEADNKVNANFWNGGFRGERRLTSRLGMFTATRFDRNVLQGIASRFEEGVGFDIKALDAANDKLNIALGASAFQQTLTPGSTSVGFSRSYPAARASADFKHRISEAASFQQTAEFLPNLSDTKVYLLNTESALVAPLLKTLAVKLSYVIRYNSTPPVRNSVTLKNTDTYFSSGLTYSF
jgi:putative salt-induced outer membrane protein